MLRSDVAFKVDGPYVIEVSSSRLPVDGTLVQLRIFACSCVDGVNVYYWHLLVQHLGSRLYQLSSLPVQAGAFEE